MTFTLKTDEINIYTMYMLALVILLLVASSVSVCCSINKEKVKKHKTPPKKGKDASISNLISHMKEREEEILLKILI